MLAVFQVVEPTHNLEVLIVILEMTTKSIGEYTKLLERREGMFNNNSYLGMSFVVYLLCRGKFV